MAADLMCRGLLLGLNEREVIELLGPPDYTVGHTFGYRVVNPDGFGHEPPLPSASLYEEGRYVLEFKFEGFDRLRHLLPFELDRECGAVGGRRG